MECMRANFMQVMIVIHDDAVPSLVYSMVCAMVSRNNRGHFLFFPCFGRGLHPPKLPLLWYDTDIHKHTYTSS